MSAGPRPPDERREHYDIERELADRLRRATRPERGRLYSELYDELFRRVPRHPQLARKLSPAESAAGVAGQLAFLRRFLTAETTFLEVGAGAGALSLEVARLVRRVVAIDVSAEIGRGIAAPPNFDYRLTDGTAIPVAPGSVDVIYSHQLMEHLHPDDAALQLRNIHTALAPGGVYVCLTPNRLDGPHDVSRAVDATATGFHLKEYAMFELVGLFGRVGFRRADLYIGRGRLYLNPPRRLMTGIERALDRLPAGVRIPIARRFPVKWLLASRIVATK